MYIGITSEERPTRRWGSKGINYRGCIKFWHAICKYGWNDFEHEIFARNLTKEEANNMEQLLIKEFNTIDDGYNLEPGGVEQGPRSPEAIEKIKIARAKQVFTPAQIAKFTQCHIGTHHFEETKAKMRNSMRKAKGRKVMCIETGVVYDSPSDAADAIGYSVGRIWAAANRTTPTENFRKHGYHWEYV